MTGNTEDWKEKAYELVQDSTWAEEVEEWEETNRSVVFTLFNGKSLVVLKDMIELGLKDAYLVDYDENGEELLCVVQLGR